MKLYLDQFVDKDVVDLNFVLAPKEVEALLDDGEYQAATDFQFTLKARQSGTTIHISGQVTGSLAYECGRCLADCCYELVLEVDFVLLSKELWLSSLREFGEEGGEEELDVTFYEGDEVELDHELRELILLELPPYAVCPDELRPECDKGLQDLMAEANLDGEKIKALEEDAIDERWSALQKIKLQMMEESSDKNS